MKQIEASSYAFKETFKETLWEAIYLFISSLTDMGKTVFLCWSLLKSCPNTWLMTVMLNFHAALQTTRVVYKAMLYSLETHAKIFIQSFSEVLDFAISKKYF